MISSGLRLFDTRSVLLGSKSLVTGRTTPTGTDQLWTEARQIFACRELRQDSSCESETRWAASRKVRCPASGPRRGRPPPALPCAARGSFRAAVPGRRDRMSRAPLPIGVACRWSCRARQCGSAGSIPSRRRPDTEIQAAPVAMHPGLPKAVGLARGELRRCDGPVPPSVPPRIRGLNATDRNRWTQGRCKFYGSSADHATA